MRAIRIFSLLILGAFYGHISAGCGGGLGGSGSSFSSPFQQDGVNPIGGAATGSQNGSQNSDDSSDNSDSHGPGGAPGSKIDASSGSSILSDQPQTVGTRVPVNPGDPTDSNGPKPPTPGGKTGNDGNPPPPCDTPDCGNAMTGGSGSGMGYSRDVYAPAQRQLSREALEDILHQTIDLNNVSPEVPR